MECYEACYEPQQHSEHMQYKFLFIFQTVSSTWFIKDRALFHAAADYLWFYLLKMWLSDYVFSML